MFLRQFAVVMIFVLVSLEVFRKIGAELFVGLKNFLNE